MDGTGETTRLLQELRGGDPTAADRLLPLVYEELRAAAGRLMRRERAGHTLQPTAVVHDVLLRIFGGAQPEWQDRAHFIGVAVRGMRQVLVDHARRRARQKRGHGATRVSLLSSDGAEQPTPVDVLNLHEALERLAVLDPRHARVVELRFFVGLTRTEIAEVLGLAPRTVDRAWEMARAWLYRELQAVPEG